VNRALSAFLRRVRSDQALALSLRRAPAQTLDGVRGLRPQDRAALIDAARAGSLAQLLRGPQAAFVTSRVQVYVSTPSIRQGQALHAHGALDIVSSTTTDVFWRVVRVKTLKSGALYDRLGDVDVVAGHGAVNLLPKENDPISLQPLSSIPFDRDEIGYGWSWLAPIATIVQSKSTNWAPGLYAIQLDRDPVWARSELPVDPNTGQPPGVITATAYFVVRSSKPKADALLCWPFSTVTAYTGEGRDAYVMYYDGLSKRARRVAVDRPLTLTSNAFERSIRFPLEMWNFIHDPNNNLGISVEPCTSFDLHSESDILIDTLMGRLRHQLFLSVGHDEYWSKDMRDHVEEFVFAGGNAAFFSANTAWWQVRFERFARRGWEESSPPSTMVCYKNVVEDSLAGVDDTRVTGLWSANPLGRSENSLTGVSSRRGAILPFHGPDAAFTVVASGTPLLGGLQPGARIPQDINLNLFLGRDGFPKEMDGADFEWANRPSGPPRQIPLQNGVVVPNQLTVTGLDGTPTNFTILAVGNLMGGPLPGWATMGYFTNHGTVFTAPAYAWADFLGDTSVAAITSAVLTELTKSSLGKAATYATRQFPPEAQPWTTLHFGQKGGQLVRAADQYPWALLEADIDGSAIAASYQGPLFLMRASGDVVERRDMENPSIGQWESTGFKVPFATPVLGAISVGDRAGGTVATLVCNGSVSNLGFDGYTPSIATFDLPTTVDSSGGSAGPPMLSTLPVSGQCVGLVGGDSDRIFAIKHGIDSWLYTGTGRRIGRWLHQTLSGGRSDLKFYAATTRGDLVCRDQKLDAANDPIDLAWRKIGRVPPNTFAMAGAEVGRLFALSGSPGNASLHWRWALADPPYREPGLLFVREGGVITPDYPNTYPRASTVLLYGVLASNGDFMPGQLTEPYVRNTLQGPDEFDPADPILHRSGWAIDFDFKMLKSVTRVSDTEAFFYGWDGSATIVKFTFSSVEELPVYLRWPPQSFWSPSGAWTTVTYVGNGFVLFYDGGSGRTITGRFVKGPNAVRPTWVEHWNDTTPGPGWTHVAASNDGVDGPYVLFYKQGSGDFIAGHITSSGVFVKDAGLPNWLSTGWDTLVPMGQTYVLFYNKETLTGDTTPGDIALVEFAHGKLETIWSDHLRDGSGFVFASAENGVGVRARPGNCQTHGVRAEKDPKDVIVNLREDFSAAIGPGWKHVVGLGGFP
jgi:hypothetical protein